MALANPDNPQTGTATPATPDRLQEETPVELALGGESILDPVIDPIVAAATAAALGAIAWSLERAQDAGEWIAEGYQHLDRSVRDFLDSNPNETALREVAGELRELEKTLRERGLPGAEEVDGLEKLLREPLKAKQRERGEDRNPARDKKLTKGEEDALKEGGVDIHEVKKQVPGGASKGDLYKDPKTGDIYIKPKGGRGPGMETGLNINDFRQYLSELPDEGITVAANLESESSSERLLTGSTQDPESFPGQLLASLNRVSHLIGSDKVGMTLSDGRSVAITLDRDAGTAVGEIATNGQRIFELDGGGPILKFNFLNREAAEIARETLETSRAGLEAAGQGEAAANKHMSGQADLLV